MDKQQLASKIWASADTMRSKIEANEYKDYILGFIFYKFLSEREEQFLRKQGSSEEDIKTISENDAETVKYIQDNIGYFIAYNNMLSTWIKKGKEFSVGDVRDALSAFNRLIHPNYSRVFANIFNTLQTGLSKLGTSTSEQTKACSDLIFLINDIPMDSKQDYDILGFVYEYLIRNFAANAGKKAGEFYTPLSVVKVKSAIISDYLKDNDKIKIYDPCSGSGSLLLNIGESVMERTGKENSVKYYAQELKQNTYNLTRMNLVMRGILPDNIVSRNGDSLADDWPWFDDSNPGETYDPLFVDAVSMNPPYSQPWDPSGCRTDPRFSDYGAAPQGKADYAFLLHGLFHLKSTGIMTIILPHGVLFRGAEEGKIRRQLIEKNQIDAIIGLPANIFYNTGIPTIIMILKKQKADTDVLIVDASKEFVKVGKNNDLRARDIKKITDTVIGRLEIPNYSRKVSRKEIRDNDYNLNIPRYVDSSEKDEPQDIYACMFGGVPESEINELETYWDVFPTLRGELFKKINESYSQLRDENVVSITNRNTEINTYKQIFSKAFENFKDYLKQELVTDPEHVSVHFMEEAITQEAFKRINGLPLVDKYEIYQILDDIWNNIEKDLEIIQEDGMDCVRKVDANKVQKKKGNSVIEVQDGWIGRVFSLRMVQKKYFENEMNVANEMTSRLLAAESEINDIVDSLSDEDRDSGIWDSDKEKLINAEVKKRAKAVRTEMKKGIVFNEDGLENNLLRLDKLFDTEKSLKSQIKKAEDELETKAIDKIHTLSDEEVANLFEEKWIMPIIRGIDAIPDEVIKGLTDKVKKLGRKYSITLCDTEEKIKETEKSLAALAGQLTGNDFDIRGIEAFRTFLSGRVTNE